MGAEVVTAVRAHGMADQVVISSFNPFAAAAGQDGQDRRSSARCWWRTICPAGCGGALTRRYSRADGIHPEAVMVDAAYVAWARKARLPVRVWTVNDEAEMRRLIALGVDAVITDVPDLMLDVVKSSLAGSKYDHRSCACHLFLLALHRWSPSSHPRGVAVIGASRDPSKLSFGRAAQPDRRRSAATPGRSTQ